MSYLGIDISHWQPVNLPWAGWAGTVNVVVIQITNGTTPDSKAKLHMANALASGYSHIGAYHYLEPGNAAQQLVAFLGQLDPAYSFCALDIEQAGISAQDVLDWCNLFDASCHLPLVLYGNQLLAHIVGTYPELSRYGVWWGEYGPYTITSTPPYAAPKDAPAGLNLVAWQYAGGNGRLAPYTGEIDLTRWDVIPGLVLPAPTPIPQPATVPTISAGPKMGIHSIVPGNTLALVQRALDAGWNWPVVKIGNDPAACDQVLQISPLTRTICRFIDWNGNWQGMQNVGSWSQATREEFAQACIQHIQANANADQQKRHTFELVNEPNPREEANGYNGLGLALIELIKAADQNGIRLALPAFPQGVPEWSVVPDFSPGGGMVELINTDMFGYIKAGSHIYTCHEGVFDADAIDKGFGDGIPGAPSVPGAGAECFRYRYLYSLLRARNEVVPLVISEAYYGGGYPPAQSNADILARAAWYDREARRDDYVIGVTPFTVNSDGNWRSYDLFYAGDELWNYISAEKDKTNGDDTMPISQSTIDAMKARQAGIATLSGELNTIISGLVADNWWMSLPNGVLTPSRKTTNLLDTIDFYHLPTDPAPYTTRTGQTPGADNIDVYERQADYLRVTNGTTIIWVKAEQVKAFS